MSESTDTQSAAPAAESPSQDAQLDASSQSPESQQAAPPAAETKKRLKQLQLKIDGESFTEDLPFEIDEDQQEWMTKNLQLSKKAQKSMQETSTMRSQVEQFVKSLKGDTANTLKQMEIDPREFAAAIIEQELAQQAMSPEQREIHEAKAELKRIQDERKKEKEDFNKQELARLQQVEYENIDNKMTSVIEKAGIPKSPYVVKKIAQYMLDGLEYKVNLQPEDVIDLVKEEIQSDIRELMNSLGEDKVEAFIGKDILDKVRKKNLAKAKQTPASLKAAIKDVGSKPKGESKPQEKITVKEFFKL